MTRDYWFGLQIGDGKCVAVTKESQFGKPIPRNDKCFLNATTSICDKEALTNFRHRYSQKLPAAIFVGSDGVDDSFSNDEQLYALYRTILYSFGTTDFDEAKKDLEDYLPRLSAKGSGDDVSIAAIFDMDAIAELSIVKDFDPEKEKTRIAEAERRKAEQREAERREAERRRAEYQEAEHRKAEQRETERRRAERRKEEQKEAASVARRQMRPSFCTYCGAKLSGGIYCPQCGEKVMEYQTDSESYNTSGRKNELREASVAVTAKTKIPHAAVDSAAFWTMRCLWVGRYHSRFMWRLSYNRPEKGWSSRSDRGEWIGAMQCSGMEQYYDCFLWKLSYSGNKKVIDLLCRIIELQTDINCIFAINKGGVYNGK